MEKEPRQASQSAAATRRGLCNGVWTRTNFSEPVIEDALGLCVSVAEYVTPLAVNSARSSQVAASEHLNQGAGLLRAPTCHYRTDSIGNAVAAGISNTHLPDYHRTFSNTINVWGTDILRNTLSNAAKDFWRGTRPQIRNRRTNRL